MSGNRFEPGPIFGWPRKEVIHRDGDPYLTRWWFISTRRHGRLYLHRFHRSDEDVLHDHPWAFWSLILWGGYIEHSDRPIHPFVPEASLNFSLRGVHWSRWHGPLSLLRRPATWRHRVEIPDELRGRVWTLVWIGPKVRDWGFHCPKGWIPFQEHNARRAATGEGCP